MKRCPKCRRDYFDDSLLYCLDDGKALLEGPASVDEPATAILNDVGTPPPAGISSETPTRDQIHTTGSAEDPPTNSGTAAGRQSKAKVLAAVFVAVLVLVGGFLGYRYFKPAITEQIRSIAVLPLQNRSDDPDTDYLSDGIAESLIFRLSQLPGIKVSPVSSVMRYKSSEMDAAKIAAELGVDAVMTGRLLKRNDNLNITVELVDVRNNASLWGEQYERKMSDLLATQREIAATITQKLQLKLSGDEKGIAKKYTSSNDAYQLYLKGRYHFAKRTKEDLYKSIDILEEAVKIDPKFALGYVGIAESWTVIPSFSYASPAECTPKAKAAAAKALELDPELPEAHAVSAMIATSYDWEWAKGEAGFKRALELDPNLAITHYRYAWTFLSPTGRHDEAIAEMKIAMDKEPLYLIQGANYAAVLMYAGRFDEAVEQARKTYDLDPKFVGGKNWLCHTYAMKGMYAESIALAEKSSDEAIPFLAAAAYSYAKTGQREKTLAIIESWKEAEKTRYVQNYWVAIAYAALGDKDAAFAELEKAYQQRDWFLQRLNVDPYMASLRGDPRFDEMVGRIGLKPVK